MRAGVPMRKGGVTTGSLAAVVPEDLEGGGPNVGGNGEDQAGPQAAGPHRGGVQPMSKGKTTYWHPETGEERKGTVHATGTTGSTIIDDETGKAVKVPHGHYVHSGAKWKGKTGEEADGPGWKTTAQGHLELGPRSRLAVHAAAAHAVEAGCSKPHELKRDVVRVSGNRASFGAGSHVDDPYVAATMRWLKERPGDDKDLFSWDGPDGKRERLTAESLAAYRSRHGDRAGGPGDKETMQKGGEGSRGGHVIGHTKSGKPIYASGGQHTDPTWSVQDHQDAQQAHTKQADEMLAGGVTGTVKWVLGGMKRHSTFASQHFNAATELKYQNAKAARTPTPLAKAVAAIEPTLLEQWRLGDFTCALRKSALGLRVLTIDGGGLGLPFHMIVRTPKEAHQSAQVAVRCLARGDTPPDGVFRALDLPPPVPMTMAAPGRAVPGGVLGWIRGLQFVRMLQGAPRPGLALVPSKSNPRVKRWQRTGADQPSAGGGGAPAPARGSPPPKAAGIPTGPPKPKRKGLARPSPSPTAGRPWVDKLEHLPEDTLTHHTRGGAIDPERKKLHDQIVASYLEHAPSVPAGQKPEAVVMMGGTASGKSSIVKRLDIKDDQFVHLDADDVKGHLPEYREAVAGNARNAANMAHEESSLIMKQVRDKAIGQRKSLIMDGTGANREGYTQLIKTLKEKGYHVTLVMPDLDADTATARAKERAEKTGRWVPPEFIKGAYDKIPRNFMPIAQHADDFHMYDSRTWPARAVWSRIDGKEAEHDPKFVQEFKSRYAEPGSDTNMRKGSDQAAPKRAVGGDKIRKIIEDGLRADHEHHENLPKAYDGKDGIRHVEDDGIAEDLENLD